MDVDSYHGKIHWTDNTVLIWFWPEEKSKAPWKNCLIYFATVQANTLEEKNDKDLKSVLLFYYVSPDTSIQYTDTEQQSRTCLIKP